MSIFIRIGKREKNWDDDDNGMAWHLIRTYGHMLLMLLMLLIDDGFGCVTAIKSAVNQSRLTSRLTSRLKLRQRA